MKTYQIVSELITQLWSRS